MSIKAPNSFWEIRIHSLDKDCGLTGLCVGYEQEEWRNKQFAKHVMEWLPEFALKDNELEGVDSSNMVSLMRKAAQQVYKTEKFKNRGEFGEIFLHMAQRHVFGSSKVISKIYFKTALNDTVKGFDSVHVVNGTDGLELWLGEAKFYTDVTAAIREVILELNAHTDSDYLRQEFSLILDKIDDNFENAEELRKLMHRNTSLDTIFQRLCIPILITYDSKVVQNSIKCDDKYVKEFEAELTEIYRTFIEKKLPKEIKIHLFLLPLHTKSYLITALDDNLKRWQKI